MKVKRSLSKNYVYFDQSNINGFVYRQLRSIGLLSSPAFRISEQIRINRLDAGSFLYKKGSSVTDWSMVISGLVAKNISTGGSEQISLSFYGMGSWFGEHSIIMSDNAQGDYFSLTDTVLMQMPATSFLQLYNAEFSFAKKVGLMLAKKLGGLNDFYLVQRVSAPSSKIIFGLAFLADAFSSNLEQSPETERIVLSVPQSILASVLGVSRSTFSEQSSILLELSMLKLSYGSIEITNVSLWKKIARFFRNNSNIEHIGDVEIFMERIRISVS